MLAHAHTTTRWVLISSHHLKQCTTEWMNGNRELCFYLPFFASLSPTDLPVGKHQAKVIILLNLVY